MSTLLIALPTVLFGTGVFLLSRVVGLGVVDIAGALRVRFQSRARQMLYGLLDARQDSPLEERKGRRLSLPAIAWAGVGLGAVLAVLWHHAVLSVWFLVFGAGIAWVLAMGRQRVSRENLTQIEGFVGALASIFAVDQSVFWALRQAAEDLDEGVLKDAVDEAVRRYAVEADRSEALQALDQLNWPYLSRLRLILDNVSRSDDVTIREALGNLRQQVRATRQLRDRAKAVLTLTRLTLRFLQAANVAAVLVVTLVPMWREYYSARPITMMAATGMALVGSWYFAGETRRIEELV